MIPLTAYESLRALCFFLEQRPEPSTPTTTLLRLAELVLTLNKFSFNSSHFLQVRGVAMGTHMAPRYACLFVGYVEYSLFQSYSGPYPQPFLQHVDDIIGAASVSCLELENFIYFASNFHPAITFTCFISDSSLPFLNISVSISGDRPATNIHYKPTVSHSYLDYTSSHPASSKDFIPVSQFLCLRRICSDEAKFDKGASEMSTFFLNRGFPTSV
eukprot:g21600.t1